MTNLIIDGQLADNSFTHIADDTAIPASGDISVGWNRWLDEADSLFDHNGTVAPRLNGSDDVLIAVDLIKYLPAVFLEFPAFADGRCYSYATQLRRAGYTGQIRAIGNVLRDQMFYMQRVGINAFEVDSGRDAEAAIESLKDFSQTYQSASDNPQPIYRRA